jgi:dihydroxyacetone kinase-like predicted kinase
MMQLNPDGDLEQVAGRMVKALDDVISGEITIATRSVEIDCVQVEKDQVIGLLNGKLVVSTGSVEESLLGLLEKAGAADLELITLFYGQDLTHNEANRISDLVRKKYPAQEIEIQDGGQPHYQFILSVE